MKTTLMMIAVSFALAQSASAAAVKGAKYNAAKNAIEVDVVYGGGCQEHKFKLEVGGCLESFPVQCEAQLVDLTTTDFCEAIVGAKATITLKDAGLDNAYFSRASLTIVGDRDFGSPGNKPTSATVRLPEIR